MLSFVPSIQADVEFLLSACRIYVIPVSDSVFLHIFCDPFGLRRSPTRVTALEDEVVTSVACGSHFTAAITNQRLPGDKATISATSFPPGVPATGRLWVWGHNQVLPHP